MALPRLLNYTLKLNPFWRAKMSQPTSCEEVFKLCGSVTDRNKDLMLRCEGLTYRRTFLRQMNTSSRGFVCDTAIIANDRKVYVCEVPAPSSVHYGDVVLFQPEK